MKALILSDLFFELSLIKDSFSFLENKFNCKYDYFPGENDFNSDLIVAWGSGCLKIFENINFINSVSIVLISPYLDFDRFFLWFKTCENYEKEYFKRSGVSNKNYYRQIVDLKEIKNKKVFLNKGTIVKNLNIFIGGRDKIINPEDSLKLDFFFRNTSIHYLEDLGFVPFFEDYNLFRGIFEEYILNEYFRTVN